MKHCRTVFRSLIGFATVASAAAQTPEPRLLPFPDELRRARSAIGPDAECRVLVEDVLARCDLWSAGMHAIQIHFSDVSLGLVPRRSVTLVRGSIEPQQFTKVIAAYGIPTEVIARCLRTEGSQSNAYKGEYVVYVGDINVTCDSDVVSITYARRF